MNTALAINGGMPVRTAPWRESNALGAEEAEAVRRVLVGGRLSLFQGAYRAQPPFDFLGGPEVRSLERLAGETIGIAHAVAVNSATSGLYAAIGALGLGFGDEVIVSPYTMSACVVAPLVYGAIPVFADVELATGSLDPASVRACITPRTRAILIVHQFGIPADMGPLLAIAREHRLRVIEDCAQAWGARYAERNVGTMGDIGIFSFNVHKTIQCGEGGLCVTNDPELAFRLQLIRNHGEAIVEDAKYEALTNIVGWNYRMTELQAAIATEQLKKLRTLNDRRMELAARLTRGLSAYDCFSCMPGHEGCRSTYYVYPVRYHQERCGGVPRQECTRMFRAEGIPFSEGYMKPLYLLPLFQKRTAFKNGYPWNAPENRASQPSYAPGTCPNAERLHSRELLLHFFVCHPQTVSDMDTIVEAAGKVVGHAKKHGPEGG